MNITKNMEAIFLISVALAVGTGYAQAHVSAPAQRSTTAQTMSAAAPLQTVTVSAKRMSAEEKAAFDALN